MKPAVAGHFGEGAKVEINRLVQEDCTVQYWTGNAAWTFDRRCAEGCTKEELHVIVTPGQELYDFVAVAVIAESSYKGRLLEQDRFLFLQGDYHKFSSPALDAQSWSGLELLIEEAHWGKAYLHGILVANAPTYTRFGLNYTGKWCVVRYFILLTYCMSARPSAACSHGDIALCRHKTPMM